MPTSDEEAFFSDEEEELEEDDDADEDEKRSIRDKAYQKYLPNLKNFVKETCGDSKPDLVTDKVAKKSCAVCPTTQWFKGWKALLAHAETFKKKRIQQHRGYGDAIREALKNHGSSHSQKEVAPAATRMTSFDPEAANSHLIVWPPLVVVRAVDKRVDVHEAVFDLLDKEAPDVHKPHFIAARGSNKLLVFRAEAVGYLEAKMVSELLSEHRSRRGWNPCIHGYLATPKDMDNVDPDRHYVEWTEESHYVRVQQAQKKDKEEHDNEKARLKEMELQVENLTENEFKFKERKERFELLIDFKQKEIENQKKKADDMEKAHLNKMRNLDADFQKAIKVFEATNASRLKRWREQLQGNEERLEEERMKRMKEIETLQTQFYSLRKDIKQKEAEKAVERELEVMQKKKNFMAELAKTEACFNENARKKETKLQEKQHLEVMKLMEEAEKEREALLQEWLRKQEKEKKEKENLLEEVPECCLCMDALTEKNRAVFRPCGHARICLECALDVFKAADCKCPICPICRTQITKKPTLLPKFYI